MTGIMVLVVPCKCHLLWSYISHRVAAYQNCWLDYNNIRPGKKLPEDKGFVVSFVCCDWLLTHILL